MKLRQFEVKNYRSLEKKVTVELDTITVIVGANNEGKSNLVRAIHTAVSILEKYSAMPQTPNAHRSATRDPSYLALRCREYFNAARDRPKNLSPTSKAATYFRLDFELSDEEISEFKAKFNSQINKILTIKITITYKSGSGPEGRLVPRIEVELIKSGKSKERLSQQLGKIALYISSKFSFVMSDAVRPGAESIRDLRALIEGHMFRLRETDETYRQALDVIQKTREELVSKVASEFKDTLEVFINNLSDLKINVQDVIRSQTSDLNVYIDDGVETGLTEKGDGIQSLFNLALLQHTAASKRRSQQDMITVIEEPEAHLNSGAIYPLRDVIDEIARDQQIIIVTHSAIFVRRSPIGRNIIVSNGTAKNAKSISEIRGALGILPSESLSNCEAQILVEGEIDKRFISSYIERYFEDLLHKAIQEGRLEIVATKGVKYLDAHVNSNNMNVVSNFVITDGDDPARSKVNALIKQSWLSAQNHVFTVHPRRNNHSSKVVDSTIEDIYSTEVLTDALKHCTGADIAVDEWEKCPPTGALERAEQLAMNKGKSFNAEDFKWKALEMAVVTGDYRKEALGPIDSLLSQIEDSLYPSGVQ